MSNSKVTVEYHDPSGVFPLVWQDIAAKLPLRNLNWQSPPRPLRQIKSLHLDFVPDKQTKATLRPYVGRTDSDGPQNSIDIVRSGAKATKERRHQIPGFRSSAYLKVYVLRCDDKDAYKQSEQRRIREWLKEVAQSDSKQDHDASEWLILHVVVPDTIAASEPRWRESSKDPDDLKERKSGPKLIGKSTRTVFDRLRADFNDSKSGVDRIAQIRIVKQEAPADLLPTPAVAPTYEETAQERENAWNDLVSKLKSLILGPFDRRVRQYEIDIADQEERRSLPGWNFCTFFIHKEGLAIALESIGLVEDALAIYDELSLGLEVVLREMASGQAKGTATSFADHTNDIQPRIFGPPESTPSGVSNGLVNEKHDAQLLFTKDYRDQILRSNISVFDFMCYIFHRQKALILRLANAQSARLEDAGREGGEDLVLTAEVCWRASNFIHVAARALRQDQAHGDVPPATAEGLVCSWTWAVAGQVLAETAVPALLDLTNKGVHQLTNGAVKRPATSTGIGANTHPQRTSSLPDAQAAVDMARPPALRQAPNGISRPATGTGADSQMNVGLPGQADLATYRAELILMRRRVLEQLARFHGWYAGSAFAKHARTSKLDDLPLEDASKPSDDSHKDEQSPLPLDSLGPFLRSALASKRAFETAYEKLTGTAIKHFGTATQYNSAERLLGDLAMLKCQQDDWLSAATYFEGVAAHETYAGWDMMDLERLSTYTYCLKRLNRKQEFVRGTLALLARTSRQRRALEPSRTPTKSPLHGLQDHETTGVFLEAIEASSELELEEIQPLKDFFGDVQLDPVIAHHAQTDAICLTLSLKHVLDDEIALDEARVRLVGVTDPTQEVWLESVGRISLLRGTNTIQLGTHNIAYGPYLVDTVQLKVKKLCFVEQLRTTPDPTPLGITVIEPTTTIRDSSKPPAFVFLYPHAQSFAVSVKRARETWIDKPRHLELSLQSGRNQVTGIDIRIRPTTAGLRLHLGDAALRDIALDGTVEARPGYITLGQLSAGSTAGVVIPYTTEQTNKEVTFRLEVQYTTPQGGFTYITTESVADELPLNVDVNDIFQLDDLYSSFTVRTTTQTPLRILDAELRDSPMFAVEAPPTLPLPLTVLQTQPVKLLYNITRKFPSDQRTLKRDAALALKLQYEAVDGLYLSLLERRFTSDLQESSFGDYHRLLLPLLLERARQSITGSDLEIAVLLDEAHVPDFHAVGWSELIATLPLERRDSLQAWLRLWHDTNAALPLDNSGGTASQEITISVDVPNIDIVFSASLQLPDTQPPISDSRILVLGQPVTANVRIRHSASWSAKSLFPNVPTFKIHGEDEPTAYVINVDNEADAWLIGGQKRKHFVPVTDEVHTFSVVLIPLRTGRQSLPMIEVQLGDFKGDGKEQARSPTSITCETHYESAGELVHVIRDLQTTTVYIPDSTVLPPSRPGTSGSS
ncbi:hypothetical protein Slin15195_G030420 [Septoria linicola]|uniref:Trafficking protein particle complex subunit 10 n=1 Tax=Septoria linicola TaxID=215465 RepID=A0A9Q9APA7_9PEZI|nr:hypothetical protein Slin14017_G029440 [Septoria linicola]USW49723.1 hypothetical protein Slin15195_G030420 [Septoria linicola]